MLISYYFVNKIDYADCILCRWVRTPTTKIRALGMTLNCIGLWGFFSEDILGGKYSFIAITSISSIIFSVSIY